MLVSTEILSFSRVNDVFKVIKMVKDAGFDAYDFTMCTDKNDQTLLKFDDYLERAKQVRKFADEIGIVCNQTHSFFPTLRLNNEEWNKMGMKLTIRSLEISGILGAKYCIVHPCNDYTAEENQKMYLELMPYAKKAGVKIALENMWNWEDNLGHAVKAACSNHEDFKHHLDLLPTDMFDACLDLGHAEMKGLGTSALTMIDTLKDRLTCLHIHDNDKHHDNHKLPFTMAIDYEMIIDALAKANYQGDITFEADTYASGFPVELYPDVLRLMCQVGKYIRKEIEKRRAN